MSEAMGARSTIAVFGAGAWGSALALTAARAGHQVILYARNRETVETIARDRTNPALPEAVFPPAVIATHRLADLAGVGVVLLVVPAQAMREAIAALAPHLPAGTVVVNCAKGIERATGLLLADVIGSYYREGPVAVLSGPGFAADVARGLPTAVTIAADDMALAERLARLLAGPAFRPYAADDVIGVELGGALKNVLAIAAGIVTGRGLGASAQAAVITRGFVEMRRLAASLGARAETLLGLSGFGDLLLTCSSVQSRNYSLGLSIGGGADPAAFGRLAEGAATAAIAVTRAEAFGLEVPIMAAVADVLDGRASVDEVTDRLMSRPLKREDAI